VNEEQTTKTVNTLNAGLTRIRNELKHHDTPCNADDNFGNKMTVTNYNISNYIPKKFNHVKRKVLVLIT